MNIDNFEIHCFAHPQTVTIIWIEKIYNMNAREWTKYNLTWIHFLWFLNSLNHKYVCLVIRLYLENSLISNYKKASSDSEDVVWGEGGVLLSIFQSTFEFF